MTERLDRQHAGRPCRLRGLATNASGDVHVVAEDCLYTRPAADATGWTKLAGCNANTFPISSTAEVLTMEIIGQFAYVSMADEGVIRYDMASSTSSVWSSANVLHSDQVTDITQMGSQILFASEDAGIARYNPALNLWQATWSSANWLADDDINGLEVLGSDLWVLAGSSIQRYDISSGVFTAHSALQTSATEDWAVMFRS